MEIPPNLPFVKEDFLVLPTLKKLSKVEIIKMSELMSEAQWFSIDVICCFSIIMLVCLAHFINS